MEIEFWLGYDFKNICNKKLIRSIGTSRYSDGVVFIYYSSIDMVCHRCKQLKVKRCYSI